MQELEKEIQVSDELSETNSEGDNDINVIFGMLNQGRKEKGTAQ